MTAKELYDMKLHEVRTVTKTCRVIRVPGGWVYSVRSLEQLAHCTFVPYSKEFHPDEPKV